MSATHYAAVAETVINSNNNAICRGKDIFAVAVIAVEIFIISGITAYLIIQNQKIIGIPLWINIP